MFLPSLGGGHRKAAQMTSPSIARMLEPHPQGEVSCAIQRISTAVLAQRRHNQPHLHLSVRTQDSGEGSASLVSAQSTSPLPCRIKKLQQGKLVKVRFIVPLNFRIAQRTSPSRRLLRYPGGQRRGAADKRACQGSTINLTVNGLAFARW